MIAPVTAALAEPIGSQFGASYFAVGGRVMIVSMSSSALVQRGRRQTAGSPIVPITTIIVMVRCCCGAPRCWWCRRWPGMYTSGLVEVVGDAVTAFGPDPADAGVAGA